VTVSSVPQGDCQKGSFDRPIIGIKRTNILTQFESESFASFAKAIDVFNIINYTNGARLFILQTPLSHHERNQHHDN
jgi:hypothetical protein